MVDVLLHRRNQNNDVETRVARFLEIVTKYRCFGIQCNSTLTPNKHIHFLRYMYNNTIDKTPKDIRMATQMEHLFLRVI